MNYHLIGLAGKAGSGKDSVAQHLMRKHNFLTYAFASPLKAGLMAMLDIPKEQLEDREWKERKISWLGRSPRELMQTLGTEWGRDLVNQSLWLILADRMLKRIPPSGLPSHIPGVVITDVRFEDEANFIRDRGGRVFHFIREETSCKDATAQHPSEAGVWPLPHEVVFQNTGTLSELYSSVDTVINTMLNKRAI